MQHEGLHKSGDYIRSLAFESGFESEGAIVVEKLRQEPGARAVVGGLFRTEQDTHQAF